MRVVVQRVSKAAITINGEKGAELGKGLVVLLGIESADSLEDVTWLVKKIVNLRIFNDTAAIMNLSVNDVAGDVLIVSQFTLHAQTKKGNRPSYIKAAHPEQAIPLYEAFVSHMQEHVLGSVATGQFGAHMEVSLINDGPVTLTIDSKNKE
ncbi:MAG: D-tyrosyl-tRNA(Tyr) deacylase [Schleiferiaceae bacterium]|nr:D-tyrosyl-tRNA(Tyr) deacylase [Schleiferiaceae bacterium]